MVKSLEPTSSSVSSTKRRSGFLRRNHGRQLLGRYAAGATTRAWAAGPGQWRSLLMRPAGLIRLRWGRSCKGAHWLVLHPRAFGKHGMLQSKEAHERSDG